MFKLPNKITALVAASLLAGMAFAPGAQSLSTSANPTVNGEAIASITAVHGTVFKRGFVDWDKEVWGEPEAAGVNDELREGMQIGTGNESWAEVAWPNVKTRAWANTVFAIAPNKRLVYLTGGEMLFRLDKHRQDKDQSYYIWTKVLQARIRGTTVLVQAKGNRTRFSVMEGTVEITNRLDHSRVTIKPGVVYEVVGYKHSTTTTTTASPSVNTSSMQGADNYKPKVEQSPTSIGKEMTDILYDSADKSQIPLFRDSLSSTNIYPANSEALKNHPLTRAGGQIDSMPLIEKEQANLPGFINLLPMIKLADQARLTEVVSNSVKVEAVPSNVDYFVGDIIGKTLRMPDVVGMIQPRGVIFSPGRHPSPITGQTPPITNAAMATPMITPGIPIPITETTAEAVNPAGNSSTGAASLSAAKEIFGDTEQPVAVPEFAQRSLVTPLNSELQPAPNPANAAFQPLPGAVKTSLSNGVSAAPTGLSAVTDNKSNVNSARNKP